MRDFLLQFPSFKNTTLLIRALKTGILFALLQTTVTAFYCELPTTLDSEYHSSSVISMEGSAESNEDVSYCLSTIQDALEFLPTEHTAALDKIVLVFDEDATRGQAGGSMMKIRCSGMSEEEMVAVVIHEMGHVVDTGLLQGIKTDYAGYQDGNKPVYIDDPSADFYKISWISNYETQKNVTGFSFVSGYAKTDPFEDFAETYLYYILHGKSFRELAETNDELAEKYEFLENEIFNGVEYFGTDEYKGSVYERPYDSTLLDFNW